MITRKKASIYLGVSVATVIRLEQKGLLTPIKYGGSLSKVYYKKEEIEALTLPK